MTSSFIVAAKSPLLVVSDAGTKQTVFINSLPFRIGRLPDRDLKLNDSRVSRAHASIVSENGAYVLVDENSRFGTFLNGARIERAPLCDGDRIELGQGTVAMVFRSSDTQMSTAGALLSRVAELHNASELDKLTLFLQAARSLNTSRVVDDIVGVLLEYTLKITGAARGFVFLRDAAGEMKLVAGRDSSGTTLTEAVNISQSVLEQSANTNREFLIGDTSADTHLAGQQSIVDFDLRTIIALPIRRQQEAGIEPEASRTLGVLYLDSKFTIHGLSGCSHDILRAIANEAAMLVENAQLMQAEIASRQYQQELSIAASIQRRLISASVPDVQFAKVSARSMPCKDIGGDFYDFISTPRGLAVVVADVSGKGISAALLASVMQGMIYAQLSAGTTLVEAIVNVNHFVCSRMEGQKYATLAAAQIAPDGSAELICCGHVPPILVVGSTSKRVLEGNLPIGLLPQATFESTNLTFGFGDRLIIVTDGITEAEDAGGNEFGSDRFQSCTANGDCMEQIFTELRTFIGSVPLADDCTVLELQFTGAAPS